MSDMDMTAMGDAGKAMPVPRGQYSDTETYDYLDFVYSGDASYIAKKLTTGNPPAENNEYWQLFARGGTLTENSDVSNTTVTFETAETRSNIFSRESLRIIAGKVSKMYSDLKAVAFSGKYTDLPDRLTVTNNDLANVPGTAWDAVRGAQIRKDLDKLNSDLSGNAPFDIILRRNYDRETASGWKNLLQWYDNNVRTGYLMESANNGEITLYLQNSYGDIRINNNSIKSIVDTINTLKGYQHISSNLPGSTWTEIVNNMKSYTMVVTSLFKSNYQSLSLGSDSSAHILCICRSYSDWGFAFDIGVDGNDIYFTVTSSAGIKGWKKLC